MAAIRNSMGVIAFEWRRISQRLHRLSTFRSYAGISFRWEIAMTFLRYLAAAATALVSGVATAEAPPPYREPPPIAAAVAQLNLDAARAQQVVAILENSRARARAARQQIGVPTDDTTRATMRAAMDAIRSDTDQQLAAILSSDELVKLKEAMPGPPGPGHGPRGRATAM